MGPVTPAPEVAWQVIVWVPFEAIFTSCDAPLVMVAAAPSTEQDTLATPLSGCASEPVAMIPCVPDVQPDWPGPENDTVGVW